MYILRLKHMFRLLTFALIRFFLKKKTFCCLCFASLCTTYRMKILDFLHNMAHTLDDQWKESHNMCCAMSLRQCDNAYNTREKEIETAYKIMLLKVNLYEIFLSMSIFRCIAAFFLLYFLLSGIFT